MNTEGPLDEPLMNDEQAGDAVAKYLEYNPELLQEIVPEHDLWPSIESRISARVIAMPSGMPEPSARTRRPLRGWIPVLIAALALIATTAGLTYVLTTRGITATDVSGTAAKTATNAAAATPSANPAGAHATGDPAGDPTGGVTGSQNDRAVRERGVPMTYGKPPEQLASSTAGSGVDDANYENGRIRELYNVEIGALYSALEARRGTLNPSTVAVIEQNLRVIDNAIMQSKAALAKDPNSKLLNDQLDRSLAKKTGLLRTAALLPAA